MIATIISAARATADNDAVTTEKARLVVVFEIVHGCDCVASFVMGLGGQANLRDAELRTKIDDVDNALILGRAVAADDDGRFWIGIVGALQFRLKFVERHRRSIEENLSVVGDGE